MAKKTLTPQQRQANEHARSRMTTLVSALLDAGIYREPYVRLGQVVIELDPREVELLTQALRS